MGAKPPLLANVESGQIRPVRTHMLSRLGLLYGSTSDPYSPPHHCRFFPAKHPIPVALNLQLEAPVVGSTSASCNQVNRPTLLIHAQDPNFCCSWFSRAIDFGEESGNLAFWMLQKTAVDKWFLCLRRVSGEVATYHLKTKHHSFPLKLKRGRVNKEFKKWPRTITVSWACEIP
jgi:hypothetical protein